MPFPSLHYTVLIGAIFAAGVFPPASSLSPAPATERPKWISCEKAESILARREKILNENLGRLRNRIRSLKGSRGAFTPGGKHRLFLLKQRKENWQTRLKRLGEKRGDLKKRARAAKKKARVCRIFYTGEFSPAGGRQARADAGKILADRKALEKAGKKKAASMRARLVEIDGRIAQTRKILLKYRGRKVHGRFKRRIRNYHALIRKLQAERTDLVKELAARPKSPPAKGSPGRARSSP